MTARAWKRGGTVVIAAVLAASFAGPGRAQRADTTLLQPGVRIRLWLLPDQPADANTRVRYEGNLVGLAADTLFVRLHRHVPTVAVPRIWLEELRVSEGRPSRVRGAWRGARMGLLLGAGLGAVVGSEVANSRNESGSALLETIGSRAALYGLSAGFSGLFWGLANPGERWRRVQLPPLPPVSGPRSQP